MTLFTQSKSSTALNNSQNTKERLPFALGKKDLIFRNIKKERDRALKSTITMQQLRMPGKRKLGLKFAAIQSKSNVTIG